MLEIPFGYVERDLSFNPHLSTQHYDNKSILFKHYNLQIGEEKIFNVLLKKLSLQINLVIRVCSNFNSSRFFSFSLHDKFQNIFRTCLCFKTKRIRQKDLIFIT